MNNDDLHGPAHLAVSTLLAVVMLYDDVRSPIDVIGRASDILADAFMIVSEEAGRRE